MPLHRKLPLFNTMENQRPAFDHVWMCDTAWVHDRDAARAACTVNVNGAVLIARHPAVHPLQDVPCGIVIMRVAGQGRGRQIWYN